MAESNYFVTNLMSPPPATVVAVPDGITSDQARQYLHELALRGPSTPSTPSKRKRRQPMTQESESDEETEAFVSMHGYGASHWRMLASEARVCWARWFSLPDNMTAIRVGSQMKQHQLRRPVEIANAEPNSFIRREIDAYYATNLATRLPTSLSAYWVRYYRSLTFISPASHQSGEHCMSFHEKDVFCTVEGLFYKLSSIVLPAIQGKIDVFLLAYPMLPCMVDPVLGQTVYRKSDGNIALVHVSPILHQYAHFMPYNPVSKPYEFREDDLLSRNAWYTAHY